MPKLRTRKIAVKRFKITKTGKVIHRTKGARHIRRTKSKARQRRQDTPKVMTNMKFIKIIKQLVNA